ncbi:MAG: DNA gyrase subunit A [Planctomycetota bacterium]
MPDAPVPGPQDQISDLQLTETMKSSYVDYAMSVIVSRALPDVRDGLKPSQRRILYVMHTLGLRANGKTRKCAGIVGETMGNYHPHGDSAIYHTLVRMGQPWSMRYTLVTPQGNFGSQDGDPPAAYRYTEAKMDRAAEDMMGDELGQETVPFVPNFDQRLTEPTVLPAMFPNLMCNGSEGIAVGMATKIPPHNITEVCNGLLALLDDPAITPAGLMQHIKGPDFPTGGIIIGTDGIRQAYCSTGPDRGRGPVMVRAVCEVVEDKKKSTIVVTELPYQVTRHAVVDKVRDLMRTDRVKDIADVHDMSDKNNPLRIEIELKKDANAAVVLNQLYKYTPLQDTYGINIIALAPVSRDLQDLEPFDFEDYEPIRPVRCNLKDLLEHYRDHRYCVIRRRKNFKLKKARARLHLVEGRLKALDHIDKIIKLIRGSNSTEEAQQGLIREFEFTELQADDILGMALRQLTGLARTNLEAERDELRERISYYEKVLGSRDEVYKIIKQEVKDLQKKYGDARLTRIEAGGSAEIDRASLEADEEVIVTISREGYVKRVPMNTYRRQGRAGVGVSAGDLKEGDFIEHLFVTSTHQYILVFTERGKLFWLRVWDLPEMGRTARGRSIRNFVQIEAEDRVTAAYQVRDFEEGFIIMATRKGVVKKTALSEYGNVRASGIIAIRLDEGDQLIGVQIVRGDEDVILGTRSGMAIRFPNQDALMDKGGDGDEDSEGEAADASSSQEEIALGAIPPGKKLVRGIRTVGRVARGVRGIKLRDDDAVMDMVVVPHDTEGVAVLTVCALGYGKRTALDEYRCQSRGGKGIINIKANQRNGDVVALKPVVDNDELMLISEHGQLVRFVIDGESMREMGRNTQGVRLKKLDEGDRIVAVTRIPRDIADRNDGDDDDAPDDTGGDDGGDPGDSGDDKPTRGRKAAAPVDSDEAIDARLGKVGGKSDAANDAFEEKYGRGKKKKGKKAADEGDDDDE